MANTITGFSLLDIGMRAVKGGQYGPSQTAVLPIAPRRTWARNTTTDVFYEQAYRVNSIAFPLTTMRVEALAKAPYQLYKRGDKSKKPVEDCPLMTLLQHPNPWMDVERFTHICETYRVIGGVCYIKATRDANGFVTQLFPYTASQITPHVDQGQWVDKYIFRNAEGYTEDIPITDIIEFGWPSVDVIKPWLYVSPLVALCADLDIDIERAKVAVDLLIGAMVPSFAVLLPQGEGTPAVGGEELNRLTEQLRMMQAGRNRARATVLGNGAKIQKLGVSPKDMQTSEFANLPEQRACTIYGIPIQITSFGAGLQATQFKNFEEAEYHFYARTMKDAWTTFDGAMNRFFWKEKFAGDNNSYVIGRDYAQVAALQDDENDRQQMYASRYTSNWSTLNEVRLANNEPVFPDDELGNMLLVQIQAKYKNGLPNATNENSLQDS